ncbi:hypothetical protein [Desulfosporosinus hippei]|uniref:Poly-gamma-glutamate synthesis protein (Capsule biosynthesis protein) n=1 Tax=Desulfosporosinus hippei DSM 8344 TaxID=1121419 RepID=A0A1G8EV93_9FIRM|nr:hypothetical protein [Desulfosporosinus hippei]SDH73629.1 poly-gamma-glutamate synthesis protein (capsule biosynthesis protein) [Desulfosporosinus hippei DSM 8344]
MRLDEGQVAEDITTAFHQRSNEILQDGFVEQRYRKFAKEKTQVYLRKFSGFGKWLSRIDRRLLSGMLLNRKYNTKQLPAIQNPIECEAHRELVLAGLQGEK